MLQNSNYIYKMRTVLHTAIKLDIQVAHAKLYKTDTFTMDNAIKVTKPEPQCKNVYLAYKMRTFPHSVI